MKPPRPSLLIALGCTLALLALYHWGGSLWRPIVAQLRGEKTVTSVLSELEPEMAKRFQTYPDLTDGRPIALLGFKAERRLELWKQDSTGEWRFIKSYPFTGFSGRLGPKLRMGDLQIPEGIYGIEYLNPNSSYHLSMKVTYPNEFDREKGKVDGRQLLGDDIFIHGASVTVGCIPVGDDMIEELFYLVAKNGYQSTEVIIAPHNWREKRSWPEIEAVDWEPELYALLAAKLEAFPFRKN